MHFDSTLQRDRAKSAADRERTWSNEHSGRQHPESERPGARQRSVAQRVDRFASLGRYLRSKTDRHIRGRGRNREDDRRHVAGETERIGKKPDRQNSHGKQRSSWTLSQRPVLLEQTHCGRSAEIDRLLQSSNRERSELWAGICRSCPIMEAAPGLQWGRAAGLFSTSRGRGEESPRAGWHFIRRPRCSCVAQRTQWVWLCRGN